MTASAYPITPDLLVSTPLPPILDDPGCGGLEFLAVGQFDNTHGLKLEEAVLEQYKRDLVEMGETLGERVKEYELARNK